MPRHPPCALTHLFTTRCSHPLCNTQHTTTPHTRSRPPPHRHTANNTAHNALDGPGTDAARKNTHTQVSSQDPTACRTDTSPQNRSLCSTQPHPPHTHTHAQASSVQRARNQVKGEPRPSEPQSPHHTVRLLRKEVIQPHLPVRLPCYDFVPIASPTFDNSLPQAG
jgi:hypothetical protein